MVNRGAADSVFFYEKVEKIILKCWNFKTIRFEIKQDSDEKSQISMITSKIYKILRQTGLHGPIYLWGFGRPVSWSKSVESGDNLQIGYWNRRRTCLLSQEANDLWCVQGILFVRLQSVRIASYWEGRTPNSAHALTGHRWQMHLLLIGARCFIRSSRVLQVVSMPSRSQLHITASATFFKEVRMLRERLCEILLVMLNRFLLATLIFLKWACNERLRAKESIDHGHQK